MGAKWPDSAQVLHAVDLFVKHAYPGDLPLSVKSILSTLHNWNGAFYDAPVFARTPRRCSLRLGNCFYPHMKLVLELELDNTHYHFRADTHDRHVVVPVGHPEYAAVEQMRERNTMIAEDIEHAWIVEGLPVGPNPDTLRASAVASGGAKEDAAGSKAHS